MTRLHAPTDAEWTSRALARLDELLIDHAHLEKKASSAALTLLFRYPDRGPLQLPLSRLSREELRHFELVVGAIRVRGWELRRLEPSEYARRLGTIVRADEPGRLLDRMLVAAYIEARSCERMEILAVSLEDLDPELATMYHDLVESERRHTGLYAGLARELFDEVEVESRLEVIGHHEADVISTHRMEGRLHG